MNKETLDSTTEDKKCVYLHRDSQGVVRYVGSGNLQRPYDKGKRSKSWNNLFGEGGFSVEIVAKGLSLKESDALERYFTDKYKVSVVNKIQNLIKISVEVTELREKFYIDDTSPSGLRWKVDNTTFNRKNKRQAGDVAGHLATSRHGRGSYWKVRVGKKLMACHRVVYAIATGNLDPKLVIHHIDGNSLNNCISNLAEVSQSYNISTANRAPGKSNYSGVSVVKGGFQARLRLKNGRTIEKTFSSKKLSDEEKLQKAIEALAEIKLKYKGEYHE